MMSDTADAPPRATHATAARDALQVAARAGYAPTHAAGAAYGTAYAALTRETDLVAAMGAMVDVIIAAEHLADVATEAAKTARAMLARTMDEVGCTQIVSGTLAAHLSKRPAYVVVDDPDAVPTTYMHQPPASPNKAAIKKAIEDGETVPGAALIRPNEQQLNIRSKAK